LDFRFYYTKILLLLLIINILLKFIINHKKIMFLFLNKKYFFLILDLITNQNIFIKDKFFNLDFVHNNIAFIS
jgi:hypothetical protein